MFQTKRFKELDKKFSKLKPANTNDANTGSCLLGHDWQYSFTFYDEAEFKCSKCGKTKIENVA